MKWRAGHFYDGYEPPERDVDQDEEWFANLRHERRVNAMWHELSSPFVNRAAAHAYARLHGYKSYSVVADTRGGVRMALTRSPQ